MYIVELRLENWLCYKGEHVLRFESDTYGIVATHVDNEGRSNWLGKTSILRAIRFALFGVSDAPTEDEWITYTEVDGAKVYEASGSVGVTLSDGTVIERTRVRGKSTQVAVKSANAPKGASGAVAQTIIDSVLGLDGKDFVATSYFGQKAIAQYVAAQPATRMQTIAGWLKLGPLQAACNLVAADLTRFEREEEKLVVREQLTDKRAAEILALYFDDVEGVEPAEAIAELEAVAVDLRKAADKAKRVVDVMDRDRGEREAWRRDLSSAAHRGALLEEAKRLEGTFKRSELDKLEGQIKACRKTLDVIAGDLRSANDDFKSKAALAKGKFDGVCPVDGHACPDAAGMNAERAKNTKAAEAAVVRLETVKARKDQANEQADGLIAARHRIEKLDVQAKKLREAASKPELVAACERIERDGNPPDDDDNASKSEATKAMLDADAKAREAERHASELRCVYQSLAQAKAEREAVAKKVRTQREAVAILGRNGAQRRIAEGALAEIDAGANAMIAAAGIDLHIAQTWRHPTKGYGDTCEKCGFAFPASTKFKTCEKCGEARPPKYIERPEITLSNRSGAAEDIAGIAIQLAATAWLREKRGSAWGVVCIDEPFGALDSAHRRTLATHLATMIRGQGFEQAFVVSHNRDVNDALPALVQVTSDNSHSKVVVL